MLNFRVIGKISLLLVVFGFFMPIACDMNGFQIAENLRDVGYNSSAVFLYVVFISALAGCIIGALLLMKKEVGISFDWICLPVCIGSGLFVYFDLLRDNEFKLQSGAYIILVGWGVSLIAQLISLVYSSPLERHDTKLGIIIGGILGASILGILGGGVSVIVSAICGFGTLIFGIIGGFILSFDNNDNKTKNRAQ
jgi:MFS family permease